MNGLSPRHQGSRPVLRLAVTLLGSLLWVSCAPLRLQSPEGRDGLDGREAPQAQIASQPRLISPFPTRSEIHGSGRLQIDVRAPKPFHLAQEFELDVNDELGELRILGPLGASLALITWGAQFQPATVQSSQLSPRVQAFESLDALMAHWVGTPIPSTTLLGWLQGQSPQAPGWRFTLVHETDEVLEAHRFEPLPEVDLKITLKRDPS
jgi:outer membrane lipoprotein LolB